MATCVVRQLSKLRSSGELCVSSCELWVSGVGPCSCCVSPPEGCTHCRPRALRLFRLAVDAKLLVERVHGLGGCEGLVIETVVEGREGDEGTCECKTTVKVPRLFAEEAHGWFWS